MANPQKSPEGSGLGLGQAQRQAPGVGDDLGLALCLRNPIGRYVDR